MIIHYSWRAHLEAEFSKNYFQSLGEFLKAESLAGEVYPPKEEWY